MKRQVARYNGPLGNLHVVLSPGKSGISVFVRTQRPGQRAVLGLKEVFTEAEAAQAAFASREAQAVELGWTRQSAGSGAASKFSAMPSPDQLPEGTPLAAKAKAKAVKKAS